jgi:SET domain-containing protein
MATHEPRPHARLWLQALTPIEPGDELTIDYGWPADVAIPCVCDAAGCRGWIVSLAELPLLMQGVG